MIERAAKVAGLNVGGCLSAFDRTNPQAVKWANKNAGRLIKEISKESREAVRKVIARAFSEGIPPRQAAILIRNSVSMTEAQANAVVNLHQKIITSPGRVVKAGNVSIRVPMGGMPDAKLNKLLQAYADRLTKQRAIMIARTETIRAANEGQTLLWEQAQARGELPATIKHMWMAAASERTCPICSALDGEVVEVGKEFSFGGTLPPAHPMCRCTTGLV